MLKKTLVASIVLAAATIGAHTPSFAIEGEQDVNSLTSSAGMDRNHDGMVSKKEFLDVMSKAYDMKTTEMRADRPGPTEAQMREFLRSLYVGG
jgi:hypothetical protein